MALFDQQLDNLIRLATYINKLLNLLRFAILQPILCKLLLITYYIFIPTYTQLQQRLCSRQQRLIKMITHQIFLRSGCGVRAAKAVGRINLGCFCCGGAESYRLRPAFGPQIFRLTLAVFKLFLTVFSPKKIKITQNVQIIPLNLSKSSQ